VGGGVGRERMICDSADCHNYRTDPFRTDPFMFCRTGPPQWPFLPFRRRIDGNDPSKQTLPAFMSSWLLDAAQDLKGTQSP